MNLTDLTIRLLVIGIPGIVCYFITRRLTTSERISTWESMLHIFVYSFLSYSVVSLFKPSVDAISLFVDTKATIDSVVLIYTLFSALILSYPLALISNKGLINKIGKKLHITKRISDKDVWLDFHNLPIDELNNGWMFVRDLKTKLVYYGYIYSFSESRDVRELILSDVSVYTNDEAEHLYEVKFLYLTRNRDELTIEVPYPTVEQREKPNQE
ncbi:MAG: hypothetical protein FJY65_09570 [Calditrichaeota bacterium]|nr:hypothetical protein [Calditrichota bacterium]